MAVIEKIRVKLGAFITILIAIALLSFILDPTTLQSAFSFMSSKNKVGEINGKKIDYVDFQKRVDYYTGINQLMTGSTASNDQQNKAIQDMAWQSFIDEYLFLEKVEAAGIFVGEDEMYDLTTGDMVSPMIAQSPMFVDETGAFSKDKVVEFVQSIGMDQSGNLKLFWNYLQDMILKNQYREKYNSLFTASDFINPLMLSRMVEENNVTSSVDFVMVPLGMADSTITVSDAEIKAYYNNHIRDYEQSASRDIQYVVFDVKPSQKDIDFAKASMDEAYAEFAQATNMTNFLMRNSSEPFNPYYYAEGELARVAAEFDEYAFGKNPSEVSEIIKSGNKFMAAKVVDTKKMADSAFVQHIMFRMEDEHLADSLLNVVSSKNFSDMALQYSEDKQSHGGSQAGDLGWMTQTYMIPGFESVLYASTPMNKPFIVKSSYGIHIVNVKERTSNIEKKQVAILVKEAQAGKETFTEIYAKANDIAVKSQGKYDAFKTACEEAGIFPLSSRKMLESARSLGSYQNTRDITRWAYEAKVGDVSSVLTVDNEYFFVVALTGINKEGHTPIEEVRNSIEMTLKNQKLAEARRAEVEQKIAGCTTMGAVSEALGLAVSSRDGIAFASMSQQGFDPAFIGAVSAAQEGVVTGPVKGNIGIYVFQVKSRETGAHFTEDDARAKEERLSMFASQGILNAMMESAGVKDNRARFY